MQGYIRWDDAMHHAAISPDLERFALWLDDVVIALDRPITKAGLKCSVIKSADLPALLVQRVARLRAKKGLSQAFLSEIVQTDAFKAHLLGNKTETAVPHVSPNDLKSFAFVAPTDDREQRALARLLKVWGQATETASDLLSLSRRQKEALSLFLDWGGRRLNGRSRKVIRRHASDLFSPVSIRRNGNAELLSVTQEQGVIPRRLLDRKVVMPEGATDSYKLVEPGDFVISLRSFEGGLEYSKYRGLVSPAYTVLRAKQPICDDFYRHYFKSKDFISRLSVAVIGIRDGKQISYDDFAFLKLPSPSIEVQQKVAAVLNDAEHEIDLLTSHLEALKTEKRALMADLLTGRRRVHIPEVMAEPEAA